MLVLMGDLNAKVSEDNTRRDQVMGRHGVGDVNDNVRYYMTSVVLMVYLSLEGYYLYKRFTR